MQQLSLLLVCSKTSGKISPFITEQADALEEQGVHVDVFTINQKGIGGYIKNYFRLLKHIKYKKYDVIHAHYGLSGLMASIQRKVPVVVTFHGSDVNLRNILPFSKIASRLSALNIVVEKSFVQKLGLKKNYHIIPCGVDLNVFKPVQQQDARQRLGWNPDSFYVLFSSHFKNKVKNYPLAKEAVDKLDQANLVELKNYTKQQISMLMNAADGLLLTSFSEGSPQVIKEAMANNLPVITTPVGDTAQLLSHVSNSFIVNYDSVEIAEKLTRIKANRKRSNGRLHISEYNNKTIAKKLIAIYQDLLKK